MTFSIPENATPEQIAAIRTTAHQDNWVFYRVLFTIDNPHHSIEEKLAQIRVVNNRVGKIYALGALMEYCWNKAQIDDLRTVEAAYTDTLGTLTRFEQTLPSVRLVESERRSHESPETRAAFKRWRDGLRIIRAKTAGK